MRRLAHLVAELVAAAQRVREIGQLADTSDQLLQREARPMIADLRQTVRAAETSMQNLDAAIGDARAAADAGAAAGLDDLDAGAREDAGADSSGSGCDAARARLTAGRPLAVLPRHVDAVAQGARRARRRAAGAARALLLPNAAASSVTVRVAMSGVAVPPAPSGKLRKAQ